LRPLSLEPSCAPQPEPKALQHFGVFQWITRQQASALDLGSPAANDSAGNSDARDVLVWRAGKIALCNATDGSSLVVYGAEWDVALFVGERQSGRRPASFTALQHQVPARSILAVTYSSAGLSKDDPLLTTLGKLAADVDPSTRSLTDQFLVDFSAARKLGDSAVEQAHDSGPIGHVAR
jgi:hypothetical protein